MDQAGLRRKDTTKGPPLRILSLDGGGVRGYSMLIILQELMHRVYVEAEGTPPPRDATPKPCDYFDLIGGTGTGGLIAIMLGRLRLDLETCMDVYVKMTKRVFETDKTIAGIPYKQTLFKASKLEEAIRECVREHTIYEDEGNDGTARGGKEFQDLTSPVTPTSGSAVRRSMSIRSNNSMGVSTPASHRASLISPSFAAWGNANASLFDGRENRTKTAVTAVYKGTNPRTGSPVLLRSYDSRKEPPPEFNCTIWQAGRATSATGLAFKPIQIGHSVFTDEGAGKYNPAPQILEEAAVNEWPGREVGVFVSVGTGRRPENASIPAHEWWEDTFSGLGMFAEARRRLIAKIEDCEVIHQQMLKTELAKRGVPVENYARLNAPAIVTGYNEWNALAELNTNTRKYLRLPETQKILENAAFKMAKIEVMKKRMERRERQGLSYEPNHSRDSSWAASLRARDSPASPATSHLAPAAPVGAVELPVVEDTLRTPTQGQPGHPPYPLDPGEQRPDDKYIVSAGEKRPSHEIPRRGRQDSGRDEKILYEPPTQPAYPHFNPPPPHQRHPSEPPPRPPKTPINEPEHQTYSPSRANGSQRLPPYPDYGDGPPPIVNKLRKPEFRPR